MANDNRDKAERALQKAKELNSEKKIEVRINDKMVVYTNDPKKIPSIKQRYAYLNDKDIRNIIRV